MTIVHELFQVDKLGMVVHETLLPGRGEVAIIVDAAVHSPPFPLHPPHRVVEGKKLCFNVPSVTLTSLDSTPLTVFSQYQLKEEADANLPRAVKGLTNLMEVRGESEICIRLICTAR